MRYYFDTEFIEDGKTIDLISIGVVREDGLELYAINGECDLSRASPWVRENVLTLLPGKAQHELSMWKPCHVIRDELVAFVGNDPKPEFWAYYADYDWVALCQLFGTMMDLPKNFPKFCMDLKQLVIMYGNPKLPKQLSPEHHALNDARWVRDVHETLTEIMRLRPPFSGSLQAAAAATRTLEEDLRRYLNHRWMGRSWEPSTY